jgi:hypothetical protein
MSNVVEESPDELNPSQIFNAIANNQITLDQFEDWFENRIFDARADAAFMQSFYGN